MDIEKDTVTSTEDDKAKRRKEAAETVKSAVSQYIEELREKEGSLAKIEEKLCDIDYKIHKTTANIGSSFGKSLSYWLRKEREPSLYHLCLLTQVHHVSYDYILGLDEKNDTDQLTYGYTLDFFSYLFRTKKLEIFRGGHSGLLVPALTVASKGYFDMTRYLKFTDKILCDIFKELYYQLQMDQQKGDKDQSGYKRVLQQFISQYENTPLVSENCGISTDKHDTSSLPDNGQNKPSEKIYYGLPDDLQKRIKSLPKKYGKTQGKFAGDAGIPPSTFSGWITNKKDPLPSNLYLMAKTYGISIDSLLHPGASDEYDKKHPCKYTYGNTLRFIEQLQTAGVLTVVADSQSGKKLTDSTHRHTKNYDGENPNNMHFSCDGEPAYISKLYYIFDDVLIRMITEIEAEMSRPFNAPQSPDTAQISYEMSQQRVNAFIARYNNENLIYYQKTGCALNKHFRKWRKYSYGHTSDGTATLDMTVDLDEILKELRAVEIDASKT